MDAIAECLDRRVQEIFPSRPELEKLLRSDQKIKLYQGFDPSSPNLHIGHLVGLLQLKLFQDLGHQVIFLIGDFTGMIGDPTDKSATRTKLSREEVVNNAKTYQEQAGRILKFEGPNAARMEFNSKWLEKLTFADIIELSSSFTVQQMIERDMFQERLKAGIPIHLHEFLYPLMVTVDAIELDVDLEVGGSDQLFNMTVGRSLIKTKTGKNKFALTTKLLTDGQGRKIGKTTGNAINLFGQPADLFGQIMALPDDTVISALKLVTALHLDEIEALAARFETDPMSVKKRLAFEVVSLCHGTEVAQNAQAHFEKTVQHKELPDAIKPVTVPMIGQDVSLLDLLKAAYPEESSSNLKRVIAQGGVEVNQAKMTDPNLHLTPQNGDIVKYGKRSFRQLK